MSRLVDRRMCAQQIARNDFETPGELVAWMGAVQAQDAAAAKWAVAVRLRGEVTELDVDAAIDAGSVVRTHAMRGTWQLVAAADVRWMVALVGADIIAGSARRHRELELDAKTLRASGRALARALAGGVQMTRAELAVVLREAGVSTDGQRLAHLLGCAELEGIICGGGRRGKQATWVLFDEWVPAARSRFDRREAVAKLAAIYFRSRGPATIDDFVWWSGLAVAEARGGLEEIEASLGSEVIGGKRYWAPAGSAKRAGGVELLPAFDEYLVAYRNRDAMMDRADAVRVNAGGGMLGAVVVDRGRVIGSWRRVLAKSVVAIEVRFFEAPGERVERGVVKAARCYAAFVGREVKISSSCV